MKKQPRCKTHGHNWLTSKQTNWRTCVQPECRLLQWFDGRQWITVTFLVNTQPCLPLIPQYDGLVLP